MEKLQLDVEVEDAADFLRPLAEALRSLEKFPELPLQVFRDLVANSLHELSVSLDSTALAAGDLRVVVRPRRNIELVTAALRALEGYIHRFSLPEKFWMEARR
ncbi:hypothetical protein LU674_024735 [Pseudomonas alloputida]|uniref:Histidine kinase n=1 Tax=Pseudomonas alloputida TaxID=1940621 RepID=A0AAW7HP97_9PSED|nr:MULTISPECIES: hypothetical protein [Pseudomonas]MBH3383184.1 hypothetical protein [Pseudomonas juntendi]MBR7522708.1 hypothetical protein [Pseudomonas juntendi]MCE0864379.1 hypothetical protein [Pseudomonas alloputida]MCE0869248.1 hypothetical protein [Pseudomonas alloputida]MCE0893294.1 hypothetical protein [Pseudomonas alloputida]